jgi:hypothetical protein
MFILTSVVIAASSAGTLAAQPPQSDPFARYDMPSQCVGVRYRAESRFWRDKRPDTLPVGPFGRNLQPSTIAQVKQCVARFDIDRVSERDLLGLGFAHLLIDQQAEAERAFGRLLSLREKRSIDDRAWALRQIVDIYMDVAPTRLSHARTYVRRLDALGPTVAVDRLFAHLALAGRAKQADSVRLQEEEIRSAMGASRDITVDSVRQQRKYTTGSAYAAMRYVNMRRSVGPSVAAAFSGEEMEPPNLASDEELAALKASYRALGKPAPTLQATHWFNGRPNESYPAKNKVTLVVFVTPACDECYSNYAVLRRLAKQFGPQLDIVTVIRTVGYFRNKIVSAEDEIAMSQKYLLNDLKLPGTLGIWRADMGHRDDGRLKVLTNPNEDSYQPNFGSYVVPAFVVDKRGTMRFITGATVSRETALQNVIAALVAD